MTSKISERYVMIRGGSRGGGGALSDSLGIDFYSGFRNSGFREKNSWGGGGVQFEIRKNQGIESIDFYSDFRKTFQGGVQF